MEALQVYLSGVKNPRLKQTQDRRVHQVVCPLYGRFKNMWCRICARGIETIHSSTKCGSSSLLAGLQ